ITKRWKYSDEIYNNQFASHVTALLALSRLFDDEENFEAALNGGSAAATVQLSWIELFDGCQGPRRRLHLAGRGRHRRRGERLHDDLHLRRP
ncbi:MAG TPA: hypothetical protein VJA16_24690, partial [Thermoanaerobaculia bacterium]